MVLVVFLGFNLLSLLWTDYLKVGIQTLKPYKYYLLIFPPLITSIPKEKVASLVFAFILGVSLHATLAYSIDFFEITAPFAGKIYSPYAIYAPLIAFCALYYLNKFFQKDNSKKAKIIYLIASMALVVLLFIKPGRSGQIGFVISLVAFGFLYYGKTLKTISLLAFAVVAVLVLMTKVESTKQHYIYALKEVQDVFRNGNYAGDWGVRFGFLMSSIEVARQNPFFGSGIGDSRDAFQRLYERGKNRNFYTLAFYDGPHNQYLTFLTKLGLVGLSLFIAYLVMFFRLDIHDKEMKNLSIIFITMFCFNCLADEIMFMKPYNIYFAMMSALFMNLALSRKELLQGMVDARARRTRA